MKHYLSSKMTESEFNDNYPVGSAFYYAASKKNGRIIHTKTRTHAWTLGHGDVVVSVDGIAGGVAITHLEPVMPLEHLNALSSIRNGADIYGLGLAQALRGIERDYPSYISICKPMAYNGDGADRMPYFGAIVSGGGAIYLQEMESVYAEKFVAGVFHE